jgi:hypothetical protein
MATRSSHMSQLIASLFPLMRKEIFGGDNPQLLGFPVTSSSDDAVTVARSDGCRRLGM